MRVLMSIHPKYIERIFNLSKRYEYRKCKFVLKHVDTIIMYSTAPVKRIVGEFKIGKILEDSPDNIWEVTRKYSGLTRKEFDLYYYRRETAVAIGIESINVYPNPLDLTEFCGLNRPPQSFTYLKD